MSDRPLSGRVALVTGGGRGIGAAAARFLSRVGADVWVVARTANEVNEVAEELRGAGASARAHTLDVGDPASVERLVTTLNDEGVEVDILVNNAGVAGSAPLHRTTVEEWDTLMAVNARGPFLLTRAFLPGMMKRGWGRVVNIASVAGLEGARYIAAYTASKHALVGLTRAAAAEAIGRGVTVNALCPGYVDTDMTDDTLERIMSLTGRSREEALAGILATTPGGRLVTPEEVAEAVVFLCSPEADSIQGAALPMDSSALSGGH